MRYNFFYVLDKLGKLDADIPRVLHSFKQVDNIRFDWGNYVTELIKTLLRELKQIRTLLKDPSVRGKKKPVIILGSLQWDLQEGHISR